MTERRSGMLQSYLNTVPDRRMITDRILMIEPYDIVAYAYLGTDMGKFNFTNREGKIYEWLEDTFTDRTDSVASGLASDSTTTTITIVRAWGGSTAATHANSTAMTRISRARPDGDDADDSPSTEVTSNYNFTQILQRTINVARTKEKLAEYGVASWEDYFIDKAMKELMMDLARLPYRGLRYPGTSGANARYAGGFNTFITDNLTYATSTGATG